MGVPSCCSSSSSSSSSSFSSSYRTRARDVGEENEIHSYPTMKLFVDGAVFDYDGAGRGRKPEMPQGGLWLAAPKDHINMKILDSLRGSKIANMGWVGFL